MQHNLYGKTWGNRHPIIFSKCREIANNPKKILSFGCSTGEECVTLEKYFPKSTILGVDINEERLNTAIKNKKSNKINYLNYNDFKKNFLYFDIIFCMSVLCKWPETEELDNCASVYKFKDFEKEIVFLIKKLNKNGIIVIFNSSFFFEETYVHKYFFNINCEASCEDIKKFDKNNLSTKLKTKNYIFQKKEFFKL